eukprot:gene8618-8799_t
MTAFNRTPRQQLELDDYDDQQESPRLPPLQDKSVATSGCRAQHDFPVSAKEAPSSGSRTPRKHTAAGGVHHAARGFDQSPQASPTLGGDTAQLSKQGLQTQSLTAMPELTSADVTESPHHITMETSLRLPSSYSFSLADLYPEAPAAETTGIATAPSPAPQESAQLKATAASATAATEALHKLRSIHGSSISTNSRRGSKRGLGLFRHASSAAAAHDRHGRPTASSYSLTLRRRTTAADDDEGADGTQTVAAFQPQRWGMDSVAECDALEAVNRHALNGTLLESAPVSCHGSMPQPRLLEGSWTGPAMATSPAGAAAASRPGVAKRWLIALALIAAVGLGSLSLMMDAG